MVPCCRTVNSYIDKRYSSVKARAQQELIQVDYMGMITDLWTSRSKTKMGTSQSLPTTFHYSL